MILASFSAQFTWIDWLVVVAYLGFTTWLGAAMAGKQQTIRDFFLGGRKLPWYAVSGSIIATEISALTFVSVPWVVFQPGGNLTYLQLGIFGSLFARILVAWLLVPAYYEREIYSPYDYMHNRLGGGVRGMTTILFSLGGLLGQAARIYLTAEVLLVLMHDQLNWMARSLGASGAAIASMELACAIFLLMGVSIVWTMLGGMTTVIWTDVVLFLAFLVGAIVAMGCVIVSLDGGLAELIRTGWNATVSGVPWASWGAPKTSGDWGKFTLFDFSADPTRSFTFWAATIASTWGGLGAYGTDQLMAQRMFCCRNQRDAKLAIIFSIGSMIVTSLVAFVGIGLYAYYQTHTPGTEALALLANKTNGDRIFPVFVVEVIPVGLKGLIIAAIFAAAISSVMGILTALSQTVQTAFIDPLRKVSDDRKSVLIGRGLVVAWGVALAVMAYIANDVKAVYPSLLELGLAMAGYFGGALLAGFLLGFLPLKIDGRGFLWSAPFSAMCIFAIAWHQPWAKATCWIAAGLLLVWWGYLQARNVRPVGPPVAQWIMVLFGLATMIGLCYFAHFGQSTNDKGEVVYRVLAFPWYTPIGSLFAFFWGWALANLRNGEEAAPQLATAPAAQ